MCKGPSIKYVMFGGSLRSITWEWGCHADRYVLIKKNVARPAADIRLIALIAMPVLWYISMELERRRNADSTMHQ